MTTDTKQTYVKVTKRNGETIVGFIWTGFGSRTDCLNLAVSVPFQRPDAPAGIGVFVMTGKGKRIEVEFSEVATLEEATKEEAEAAVRAFLRDEPSPQILPPTPRGGCDD